MCLRAKRLIADLHKQYCWNRLWRKNRHMLRETNKQTYQSSYINKDDNGSRLLKCSPLPCVLVCLRRISVQSCPTSSSSSFYTAFPSLNDILIQLSCTASYHCFFKVTLWKLFIRNMYRSNQNRKSRTVGNNCIQNGSIIRWFVQIS